MPRVFVMERSTQQQIADVCLVLSVIGEFVLLAIPPNMYTQLGGMALLTAALPGVIVSFVIHLRAPSRLSLLRCVLLLILSVVVVVGAADTIIALRVTFSAREN